MTDEVINTQEAVTKVPSKPAKKSKGDMITSVDRSPAASSVGQKIKAIVPAKPTGIETIGGAVRRDH